MGQPCFGENGKEQQIGTLRVGEPWLRSPQDASQPLNRANRFGLEAAATALSFVHRCIITADLESCARLSHHRIGVARDGVLL